jgi:SOS-response transcriptional repressor LexA
MNKKDEKLLNFIESFIDARGYAPSYAEMMDGTVTKTKGTIHNQIKRLVAAGRIAMAPGVSRSIRVLPATPMVESSN